MPQKLPVVTKWATTRIKLQNGYFNRLDEEPPLSFLEEGFTGTILPRQLLNYLFYNHGENLDYSVYYTNRPFSVNTKDDLPSAASNDGVIYYVKDQQKLVMSVNSLDYHEGVINTYDVLPMRLVNPQGGYLESKDRKITFASLYNHVNKAIKTSNVFDVVSVTIDSSGSTVIALKTSYGLPITELKKNMEVCFTPNQDCTTSRQIKIKIDTTSITSGQLLYNDLSVVKDLKKGQEVRTVYNGELDYHEGVINTYDVLPMRLVNPQGGYLESKDRKITFASLNNHVNKAIKTSNVFDVVSVTTDSSVNTVIALKTSYGLPITELKKNMEVCFIPPSNYSLLGNTTGYKIKIDNLEIESAIIMGYPYTDRFKGNLIKDVEVRTIFDGTNFRLSYFYKTN